MIVNMDNIKALDKLCLSDDIAENWNKWKERSNLNALASDAAKKEESVQCVILLHMTGEEFLDIHNAFLRWSI